MATTEFWEGFDKDVLEIAYLKALETASAQGSNGNWIAVFLDGTVSEIMTGSSSFMCQNHTKHTYECKYLKVNGFDLLEDTGYSECDTEGNEKDGFCFNTDTKEWEELELVRGGICQFIFDNTFDQQFDEYEERWNEALKEGC